MLQTPLISEALSLKYGHKVEVSPIEDAAFKADVDDATTKFHAPTPSGDDGFMLLSGSANPNFVRRAVENIQTIHDQVSANIAAPVLQPVTNGEIDGQTFAVWPRKRPVVTSNRMLSSFWRRFYARRVSQWVIKLNHETLKPADPETVIEGLAIIADEADFPDDMRRAASDAQKRVQAGQWQPMHCLTHGDFWQGNLLRPDPADAAAFHVIDWGGMQSKGYPFSDLCRFLMFLRASSRFNSNCVKELCQRVGCKTQDTPAYILAANGWLGANLEHFPIERFRAYAISQFRFMTSI